MSLPLPQRLSRRERQIMEIIYRKDEATVADVLAEIPQPPSYSAVRALLRILEEKGHLRHVDVDGRYVYSPIQPRQSAARAALHDVVRNFFGGNVESAVSTLLSDSEMQITDDEIARLSKLIAAARANGPVENE